MTATLTAAAKIPTRSTVIRQTPNPTAPSDPGAPLKPPTAAEYESALRKVIPTLIKKDKENNILDHKKVRALAALQLGYKGDVIATYGRKATNDIIHDEIVSSDSLLLSSRDLQVLICVRCRRRLKPRGVKLHAD